MAILCQGIVLQYVRVKSDKARGQKLFASSLLFLLVHACMPANNYYTSKCTFKRSDISLDANAQLSSSSSSSSSSIHKWSLFSFSSSSFVTNEPIMLNYLHFPTLWVCWMATIALRQDLPFSFCTPAAAEEAIFLLSSYTINIFSCKNRFCPCFV